MVAMEEPRDTAVSHSRTYHRLTLNAMPLQSTLPKVLYRSNTPYHPFHYLTPKCPAAS
jgi:hypothetical protein